MAKSQKNRSKNRKVIIHISVMAALSITLGACSSVPDWANPVEWYQDTSDWIWGDDSFSTAKKARTVNKRRGNEIPGAGKSFPSLSSVPPRPVGIASSTQRSTIEGGLVADRAQARHAALAPSNLPRRARVAGSPPPPVIAAPPAPKGTRSYRSSSQPSAPPQRRRAQRLTRPVSNAPSAASLAQTGSINETMRLAIAQQDGKRPVSSSVPLIKPITQRSAAMAPAPIRRNTMPALSSQRGGIKLTPPPGVQAGSSMHHKAAFSPAASTAKVGVVHFSHGSSKVSGKSRNQLKSIVKKFKERGGVCAWLAMHQAGLVTPTLIPIALPTFGFRWHGPTSLQNC